jgi:hypothetical protein
VLERDYRAIPAADTDYPSGSLSLGLGAWRSRIGINQRLNKTPEKFAQIRRVLNDVTPVLNLVELVFAPEGQPESSPAPFRAGEAR